MIPLLSLHAPHAVDRMGGLLLTVSSGRWLWGRSGGLQKKHQYFTVNDFSASLLHVCYELHV